MRRRQPEPQPDNEIVAGVFVTAALAAVAAVLSLFLSGGWK